MFLFLFAEIIRVIAYVILIISSGFYLRSLHNKRKESSLSTFELIMYIIIQIAYLLIAISLIIFVFFK